MHLFLKRPFLPCSARPQTFFPIYEVSPHIPEHCPFRVQTQLIHIILYTFSPSLPAPTCTSHPCHHHISTADTQSSPLLRSTCPNHLNLPHLTTSAMLWTPKSLYKSTGTSISFSDTPHIHLTIIRSVLSRLCRFAFFIAQVSVPYVNTLWTQAWVYLSLYAVWCTSRDLFFWTFFTHMKEVQRQNGGTEMELQLPLEVSSISSLIWSVAGWHQEEHLAITIRFKFPWIGN